jgi:hypothetical protein
MTRSAGPALTLDPLDGGGDVPVRRAQRQTVFVTKDEIRAAVELIEAEAAAGRIKDRDAHRRIVDAWRAVTPRDLWKASRGLAGTRRRQDWWDIRRTVYTGIFLLILCALAVWLVTWSLAQLHGTGP